MEIKTVILAAMRKTILKKIARGSDTKSEVKIWVLALKKGRRRNAIPIPERATMALRVLSF
jgi:hypothetical protein